MKKDIFHKELQYIQSDRIRQDAIYLIEQLPEYFFTIAASSTGKYHPSFCLGEGGLVRHIKSACLIAHDLLENEIIGGHSFNQDEKDLIIFALLIHDGLKEGKVKNKYVQFDHPLLIADFVLEHQDKLHLEESEMKIILDCLRSHMGQYNTNSYSSVVLPKPNNKYSRFVHMCDYLSSRKYLEISKEMFE